MMGGLQTLQQLQDRKKKKARRLKNDRVNSVETF
jgi:hypothetical protein